MNTRLSCSLHTQWGKLRITSNKRTRSLRWCGSVTRRGRRIRDWYIDHESPRQEVAPVFSLHGTKRINIFVLAWHLLVQKLKPISGGLVGREGIGWISVIARVGGFAGRGTVRHLIYIQCRCWLVRPLGSANDRTNRLKQSPCYLVVPKTLPLIASNRLWIGRQWI